MLDKVVVVLVDLVELLSFGEYKCLGEVLINVLLEDYIFYFLLMVVVYVLVRIRYLLDEFVVL